MFQVIYVCMLKGDGCNNVVPQTQTFENYDYIIISWKLYVIKDT